MARTSVLSRPLPDASLPRNSFSRGFLKNVNWSAGMILPIFCKEVPKGSHGRIDRSVFMRTAQLNTAAFPKLDHHIDFYKIPLRLLMTRYEEFLLNVQDVNSSSLSDSSGTFAIPQTVPYFRRQDVLSLYSTNPVDQIGLNQRYGAERLLDLLGYDDDNVMRPASTGSGSSTDPFECNLNAFRLLAYQKVYYDHYRNTSYEANYPKCYNADYTYGTVNPGLIPASDLGNLLLIRYVNLRKDYFTNIYPSLNYASPAFTSNWILPSSVVGASHAITRNNQPILQTVDQSSVLSPAIKSSLLSSGGSYNTISVQQIRAIFALDKLMRASAYAPKHVKDQIEARFGVKTNKKFGNESEYLGSFMNDIVIGEVTSTANTVNAAQTQGDGLGAIGGKGVSGDNGGHYIEFDTGEDDCIIMGVMYTLVRSLYDSDRIDSFNAKFSREDYFQPEFMDLGLRPLFQYELDTLYGTNSATINNVIRGYVPRYQEYKLSVDENHGLFRSGSQLGIFVPHSNKVTGQDFTTNTPGVSIAYFKMKPSHLDSIFAQNFDVSDYTTDQFFGQFVFKFDVRQNMSVHGQPRL